MADPNPYTQVSEAFSTAQTFSTSVKGMADAYLSRLGAINYNAPTISVTWNEIVAPELPTVPAAPAMPQAADFAFVAPDGMPVPFNELAPSVTIDDFNEVAPELTIGDLPIMAYGSMPSVPSIGAVAVPDAPTIDDVALPAMLSVSVSSFAGVDLHDDWINRLEHIPELTLVEPTPYAYARGPEYASALLSGLKDKLLARLAGGSGLAPAVEQAIWDRARSRETQTALANELEIQRSAEAFGFQLPAGTMAAQLRGAQQEYYDKLSTLSRDVSIKQAELEQENLKQTIAAGMQLEGQLVDYAHKLEQLSFEAAKALADNAIQIYNASIEGFKALLAGYTTYAGAYKTIIDAELAKVEVYKAELSAEQSKVQINVALVEQFKAMISAQMSKVEIYKAQVGAAQTLVGMEKTKIEAAGEQVRAYVAQVNAETAKVEAYKAGVQAEATKVEVYKTKAGAFSAKVGAQADKARADVARYEALLRAKQAEWEGYKTKVSVEGERIKALGMSAGAQTEAYKAQTQGTIAQSEVLTKVWEGKIKQYEAGQQIALSSAKINTESYNSTRQMQVEVAKVGAQVYSQMMASSLSTVHASASIGGTESSTFGRSISYSYSNDTSSSPAPAT